MPPETPLACRRVEDASSPRVHGAVMRFSPKLMCAETLACDVPVRPIAYVRAKAMP